MICEKENCNQEAIECVVHDETGYLDGKDLISYYCPEHAYEMGFCVGCGQFCCGIDSFDFPEAYGNIKGYCDNCSDQIKADVDDGIDDGE
jgi:hypothetical protein